MERRNFLKGLAATPAVAIIGLPEAKELNKYLSGRAIMALHDYNRLKGLIRVSENYNLLQDHTIHRYDCFTGKEQWGVDSWTYGNTNIEPEIERQCIEKIKEGVINDGYALSDLKPLPDMGNGILTRYLDFI